MKIINRALVPAAQDSGVGVVVPFRPGVRAPGAYEAMCAARRAFADTWRAWLRTNPTADDVGLEREAAIKVIEQVVIHA